MTERPRPWLFADAIRGAAGVGSGSVFAMLGELRWRARRNDRRCRGRPAPDRPPPVTWHPGDRPTGHDPRLRARLGLVLVGYAGALSRSTARSRAMSGS